ncbi:TonB-dependent receptor domain-containing protein [Aurantiacibacter suaedae]|uniref:TonB-dependent receptor domain-containing protein n=1 Tax=Aurantiacibacter suaedae TaxID=2545755 RepID=UPI0010F7D50A|nr:TonB-dependent receptor [Aurantiacibacter suaedae]
MKVTWKVGFRTGLMICTAIVGAAASGAQAQSSPDATVGAAADREVIVVTGSRIRGVQPVGSNVSTLGRQQIEDSASVTVDRILQELPQVFDLGVSENSRAQSGGAGNIVYNNSVNLRGLGPSSTLVLLDGHRVANNGRATNPSVIPSLGVERLEVIADGASAIYGSDAVAGVINIIPRRSLDGVELSARYGTSDDGAFEEWRAGLAVGQTWGTGQVMVAYDHVFRSNLSGDDRDFFAADQRPFGGPDFRSTQCNPGTIIANGTTYAIPEGGLSSPDQLTAGTANLCNEQLGQDLFPEQEYDSANATFTQEITDWLTFSADGFYSMRKFVRQPSFESTNITVPSTNAFFIAPPGFTGDSYEIATNFRGVFPRNTQTGSAETWGITPKIEIQLFSDWEVAALYNYGRTNDDSYQYAGLSNTALNEALASSDPDTALDPYNLGRTTAATIAGIQNQQFIAPTYTRFTGYEAHLSGTLIELPGGAAQLATGYEGQEFSVLGGGGFGEVGTPFTLSGYDRRVDSLYGEVIIPIFGLGNAMPGFERLTLSAALRYDEYSDVGGTTNPKFGLTWEPVDGVTLRGSYGTSFRAPELSQVNGSNNFYVQNYVAPDGGAPVTGFTLAGPNTGLNPEEATSWSAGVDWEAATGLRFSATYFSVDYTNKIAGYLSNLQLLTREDEFAGTGIIIRGTEARDLVQEFLDAGAGLFGVIPGGDPDNINLFVDGRPSNLGTSKTEGIDFQATYETRLANEDQLSFNLSGTYLTNYQTAVTPSAPLLDRLNFIFEPLRFKARATVAWAHDDFRVRAVAHHVGSYVNDIATPEQKVDSYTPIDLALTYFVNGEDGVLGGPLAIGLEVFNVFDIDPPYAQLAPNGNGSGGYDATASDPIGRRFAVSLRKSF